MLRAALIAALTAVAWWLVATPSAKADDCNTIHIILGTSPGRMQQLTQTAIKLPGIPRPSTAYDERALAQRMKAETIVDDALRASALHLIDLDSAIVDVWSPALTASTQPGTPPMPANDSKQYILQHYQRYTADHDTTIKALLAACPRTI